MLGLREWGTPELGFLMNELTSSLRMIRGMPFASRSSLHKHTHTWTGEHLAQAQTGISKRSQGQGIICQPSARTDCGHFLVAMVPHSR